MAKRKSKSDVELSKARKRLRAEALPLALETLVSALGGGSMPEARIRAALRTIELCRVHDPEPTSAGTIEIRFGEMEPEPDADSPTEIDARPATDNPDTSTN